MRSPPNAIKKICNFVTVQRFLWDFIRVASWFVDIRLATTVSVTRATTVSVTRATTVSVTRATTVSVTRAHH